ncbi:MAG: hypothetical protein IPK82_05915 [Polyangiaceae bacterium]|nr:hypothetical protein [Polyangiaceae bacterium]
MFWYSVGGIQLRSEIALVSLPFAANAEPSKKEISLELRQLELGEPDRWLYNEEAPDTGEPWRAVGTLGANYLVRLFGFADFLLEKAARRVTVSVARGGELGAVEPLFLEQVLPLFWSLVGEPCLHASAVLWGEGEMAQAVAFAGRSRSGKSTLASALAGAGGLLSDDCLVVELGDGCVWAHPGTRSVRLLADSAKALFLSESAGEVSADGSKRRVEVGSHVYAVRLARVYLLKPVAPNEPAQIEGLGWRDAVAQLAGCAFRINPEDAESLALELRTLDEIAMKTAVKTLAVPRRYDAFDEVRNVIAQDLQGN